MPLATNICSDWCATDDDFAMMREVLTRRFSRLLKEDPDRQTEAWPDLLLIDGGAGQVSAVAGILAELGVEDIPLIGVAKGQDRVADDPELAASIRGELGPIPEERREELRAKGVPSDAQVGLTGLERALDDVAETMIRTNTLANKVDRACIDLTEAVILAGRVGEEFTAASRAAIAQLDALAAGGLSDRRLDELTDVFRTATRLEIDFWQQALDSAE